MNWIKAIEGLELPPLQKGAHDDPRQGVCLMEMVAFIERLPHSDRPSCTCPVIAAFARSANDQLTDAERQKLLPLVPELVGTVAPEYEAERLRHFVLLASRKLVPRVLRKAGVDEQLIDALVRAESYDEIRAAARAASAGAYAANVSNAAYAAYAAYAANAANAAANAADYAAYAANAANAAADYAAYAANAAYATDEYIDAIRGALAIGPKAKGIQSLEALPALVELAG